jgi:hypothetical protein
MGLKVATMLEVDIFGRQDNTTVPSCAAPNTKKIRKNNNKYNFKL